VKPATLLGLWRPTRLRNGGAGAFAAGWEYVEAGRYTHVGHDGGTKVRVRLVYADSLATDTHTFVYLTNGSADNVWSRTLIDSVAEIAARY
jgi:D-alanyl-D-alanine carboxypeptidase